MKILITGNKGFIGSHLQQYLTDKNHQIIGVDRKDNKEVMDVTENDLSDVDIVIHLAAQTSVWNTDINQIIEDNIKAFTHIFLLCKKLNKKLIYASSSCSVNITSMYGLSKYFDDIFSQIYEYDNYVGLRFHNVYGKNSRKDTLIGICLNEDEINLYNNGLNYRHFTYIEDVCKSIEKAFTLNKGIYNVFNPEENSTLEVTTEMQKYKPIKINLLNEKRELDKTKQKIDNTHINLLENNYTPVFEGIYKIFN